MAQATMAVPVTRTWRMPFTGREWLRLGGMYGSVGALMLVGWGLFFTYQHDYGASYAAAGGLAFGFGLRHAFDADHISAIDDTTRYLMQRGKQPLAVGYFFSLGHSTIVVGLLVGHRLGRQERASATCPASRTSAACSARWSPAPSCMPSPRSTSSSCGASSRSGARPRAAGTNKQSSTSSCRQRGFINRVMGSLLASVHLDSWQMYPVGVLFGLGFDTATEVGLLAITAAAATGHTGGGGHNLPFGAIIALPLLFTAGMSLMDTTDGVVMSKAYGWAFKNPLRKVYYNMATVSLGIFVAAGVGSVEFLQVISTHLSLSGTFWDWLNGLDFEVLGYFIVGAFILLWIGSILYYRFSGIEQKYADRLSVESSLE